MAFDLTCLQTRQAKSRLRSSSAVGGRQVTTFSSASVTRASVGILQQQPAGDVLDDGPWRGGMHLDQAQILLRGEALRASGVKAGAAMASTKSLAISSAASASTGRLMPMTPPNAETGSAAKRLLIGLKDGRAGGCAAGVGVLDDDDRGLVELLRQFPAGVEIDEVVEAEFLALQLRRAGDAKARAVRVEGRALMRVFAVAQRLGERQVDAQGGGQVIGVWAQAASAGTELARSGRACWRWPCRRRRWWQRPAGQAASGFRA